MFIISLKAALSASTFTYYLKESDEYKTSNFLTSGFGLLYAFSAYFVAYYWDFMWLDGMVFLPLIVLGIERIVDGKKPTIYVVSLALLMFSTYYIAYMVCIFSVLYAVVYYAGKYDFGKRLFISAGRFILYSILAAGLMAFALLPIYYCLKSCSATSDSFPADVSTYFSVFDFLGNHLTSLEPTIRSSGDDVLPNVYCGIITVMLAMLYYYTPSIPLREKISRTVILIILFLSMNVNVINFIWHGFHAPNDLPYRFSFIYSFVLLSIAIKAMNRIDEIRSRDVLTVGIILIAFIALFEEMGSNKVGREAVIISLAFVVAYAIALRVYRDKKFPRQATAGLLLCLMFAEIAIGNTDHYDIDQPKADYVQGYSSFQVLKHEIDKKENNGFYRLELTDLRTRMDPSWFGYNGLSTFSSMAYEKSSNMQSDLGMFSNYINSYTYHPMTPVYNAMYSLKYVVNNSEAIDIDENYWNPLFKKGDYNAYENKYCLPIAYLVNPELENWKTDRDDPFAVQNNYWTTASGAPEVFHNLPITGVEYYNIDSFGDEYDTGSYYYNKTVAGESGSFTLSFYVPKTESLYVYVEGTTVETIAMRNEDGDFLKSQTVEDEPYIFDIGRHNVDETIYVDVNIKDDESAGDVDVIVAGLDDAAFKAGYATLSSGAMKVDEMTETEIHGTVDAPSDMLLYTSINYDESWNIKIDGVDVDPESIVAISDGLLGVKVAAGHHQIDMKYSPRGMTLGIIISIVSLAILIVITIIKKRGPKASFFISFFAYFSSRKLS